MTGPLASARGEGSAPPIEVKDLTMMYGPAVVMSNLSFQVERGEVFVIMGGSGSGKSTLLKHLIGLKKPARGTILFEGEDFGEADVQTRKRVLSRMGVLYQNGALWSGLTLAENVAFESYAGYWSQADDAFGTEFGVRDFAFGSKAKYMFTTSNPTVQPYVGGGLGLHILNAHAESPAYYSGGILLIPGYSASDTEVRLGMDLGGGVKIDRGNTFSFFSEAYFSVVSDITHFSFMVGAEYMFGR